MPKTLFREVPGFNTNYFDRRLYRRRIFYRGACMKRKSPVFNEAIICQHCGKETPKKGAMQKFCADCSKLKDVERKAKWAKAHPLERTQGENKAFKEKQKSLNTKRGLVINKGIVENISHFPDVDLQWLVKIAVPFSYSASKNHLWSTKSNGHVFRRTESNSFQQDVVLILKSSMAGRKVYRNKVWLDIFVQKPDHRGDAINVLDLVADAVKEAIGIDDRWFSIRRIDWQIVKQNPRIFIGIGQDERDLFDAKLCSYCGRILPEENFGKSRRECQECTSQKRFDKRGKV